jgi:hypothetical protein
MELLGHILFWDIMRAQEAREKAQAVKASVVMKMKGETKAMHYKSWVFRAFRHFLVGIMANLSLRHSCR